MDQTNTTTTTTTNNNNNEVGQQCKPVVLRALKLARLAAGGGKSSNNFVALSLSTIQGFAGSLARPGAVAVTKTLDNVTKRYELEFTSNEDKSLRQNPDNPTPRTPGMVAINAWINPGTGISGQVTTRKAKDAMWAVAVGTVGNAVENGVRAIVSGRSEAFYATAETISAGMQAYTRLLDAAEEALEKGDKSRAQSILRAAGRTQRAAEIVIEKRDRDADF